MKKAIAVIGSLFSVFIIMMLPSVLAVEGNVASNIVIPENNYGTTDYEPTLFIWTVRWIWKFLAALGLGFVLYTILKNLNLTG